MNYNTANIEKVIQLHGELQTLLPLKDEDEHVRFRANEALITLGVIQI